jgi:hypothetical protein
MTMSYVDFLQKDSAFSMESNDEALFVNDDDDVSCRLW